ncbi:hypothetical protein WA158_004440 [Blastocystis sp. Blastoise]
MSLHKRVKSINDYDIIRCIKKAFYDKRQKGNFASSFGFVVVDKDGYKITEKASLIDEPLNSEWKRDSSLFTTTSHSFMNNKKIIENLQISYDRVIEHNQRHQNA